MHIYWSHTMGYLCGATQMGLTEQLLSLGICLTICQHAHSRTAVRNSRTETVMHALIIWYLRAKT